MTVTLRVLVTGSRDWNDHIRVWNALLVGTTGLLQGDEIFFVHGACPTGTDRHVADFVERLNRPGITQEPHPADWKRHGKAAGPIRNQQMVDAGADLCLAFILNNSRGATGCARMAEQAGIPVSYYRMET